MLIYTTVCIILAVMISRPPTQQEHALALLNKQGMLRLSEFIREGITAATIVRMREKGLILQLSRGLYQLPGVTLDVNHSLAEATKLVPKGVVCLVSALSFHGLTDTIPPSVWMAIGSKDRRPAVTHPRLQIVRFRDKMLTEGIEEPVIEGVTVRICNIARTIVDLFYHADRQHRWYGSKLGFDQAIQGMKEALRQRKTTPAAIARFAAEAGIWEKVVQPRLEVLTVDAYVHQPQTM
jgi:predicted transcriptional regulator of viral defense system